MRDEPEAVDPTSAPSTLISVLVGEAIEQYQGVTTPEIERLRLKHRLKVVQNLEDSQMKNVLRSVRDNHGFSDNAMRSLFLVVKNEQLLRTSKSHGTDPTSVEKLDPSTPHYELYKVDLDTWLALAQLCSPWAKADSWEVLALRCFRIMDTNLDGLINFRDLLLLLDLLCGSDMQRKLKLLYCLHLPGVVGPGEMDQAEARDDMATEVAADATDFFIEAELSLGRTAQFLREAGDQLEEQVDSLASVQAWLVGRDTGRLGRKLVPPLPQQHFVLLWKTLYSLFMEGGVLPETEEQQKLYHSVSVVGTLLLQIGEVGQKINQMKVTTEKDSVEAIDEEVTSEGNVKKDLTSFDKDWSITFEQLYASILTEATLVDHFSSKAPIEMSLKEYNSCGPKRMPSEETYDGSRSVFYV